jgi:uncharacterized protein with von Willebrand factor type A (vWA) domain
MSPYETSAAGGGVEYNNEESGAQWMQRLTTTFPLRGSTPEPARRVAVPPKHQRDPALVQQRMLYPPTVGT